ncbi:MAG: hypothetical protein ABI882_15565 [Acidobacteriota bacterium]
MRLTTTISQFLLSLTILLALFSPGLAQTVRVGVSKLASPIPKACEGVVPAQIEGPLDVIALTKEANCKGSGDMLIEYTYVMQYTSQSKDKKGKEESETRVFEVYIPTLKDGIGTRGVLIMTSRNGIPVPSEKMQKVRQEAGEQLEKAEERIAKQKTPEPVASPHPVAGMKPLGMYPRMTTSRGTLGFSRGGMTLDVHTILLKSSLVYVGREMIDGRDNLVFTFVPDPGATYDRWEKYVALITGRVWIDAKDRIVTRLSGWPASAGSSLSELKTPLTVPPAIYMEMVLLPDGNWMPRESRIMASEYPTLFDRVAEDGIVKYSDYQRFKTEAKDLRIDAPKVP